jgi:uncharacterized protein (TIGR03086 family)
VERSPVELLAAALDEARRLVEGIGQGQWDGPTPCAEWSVRDLTGHLVTGNRLFARAVRGDLPPAAPVEQDRYAAALRESADELLAAFTAPGALDRVVVVPFGRVPGIVALHLRLVEALVHGWDLASATGQVPRFDDESAERGLEFSRAKLSEVPANRSPFGPPQPVDPHAPVLDRLAALLGRSVPQDG